MSKKSDRKKMKLSYVSFLEKNTELQKRYMDDMHRIDTLAKILEAAPEEHSLSNKEVANYLRQWIDDMLHIEDFLHEDTERASKAMQEIDDLLRR